LEAVDHKALGQEAAKFQRRGSVPQLALNLPEGRLGALGGQAHGVASFVLFSDANVFGNGDGTRGEFGLGLDQFVLFAIRTCKYLLISLLIASQGGKTKEGPDNKVLEHGGFKATRMPFSKLERRGWGEF
jgi:hypothetical protein